MHLKNVVGIAVGYGTKGRSLIPDSGKNSSFLHNVQPANLVSYGSIVAYE
jgi:hypothetical protein